MIKYFASTLILCQIIWFPLPSAFQSGSLVTELWGEQQSRCWYCLFPAQLFSLYQVPQWHRNSDFLLWASLCGSLFQHCSVTIYSSSWFLPLVSVHWIPTRNSEGPGLLPVPGTVLRCWTSLASCHICRVVPRMHIQRIKQGENETKPGAVMCDVNSPTRYLVHWVQGWYLTMSCHHLPNWRHNFLFITS